MAPRVRQTERGDESCKRERKRETDHSCHNETKSLTGRVRVDSRADFPDPRVFKVGRD